MVKQKSSELIARPPEDFVKVLSTKEPLFLVGGQAVNLWALYYPERTSELAPFVSRDVDILGTRKTLSNIAKNAGVKPQYFPIRPPTNEVGVIIAKGTDGQPLSVEVLKNLHGISNKALHNPEYTISLGEDGVLVKVPGPIALLQAKLANVADLNQTGRQDVHHVRILTRLLPAYLADLQSSVNAERITEREMLKLMERLLTAVTSRKARRVLKNLEISSLVMFSEIKTKNSSKLHAFITKRLPRVIKE